MTEQHDWYIFTGKQQDGDHSSVQNVTDDPIQRLPDPPNWRDFSLDDRDRRRGQTFRANPNMIEMVNAALYLRRPLLVTGKPGTGKSSLAYAVAEELNLGPVLVWSINTRTTRKEGLYSYDAVGRLRDTQLYSDPKHQMMINIGDYLRLEPLGTALLPAPYTPDPNLPPPPRPRVLLIDEIDKGDIDLPNDLLHIFEEGKYEIPELKRYVAQLKRISSASLENSENENLTSQHDDLASEGVPVLTADENQFAYIHDGLVQCDVFPFIVLTSNGERDFPPAFLRRCLQLEIEPPSPQQLSDIVRAHLGEAVAGKVEGMITDFVKKRSAAKGDIATDQLLNAIYLTNQHVEMSDEDKNRLTDVLLRSLGNIST